VVHAQLAAGETWGRGIHEVPQGLTLSGAGATLTVTGCAEVRLGPDVSLTVEEGAVLEVKGSTGLGVALVGARLIPGSDGLTVTGSGAFPLCAGVDLADGLPRGASTGNARNEVLLQSLGPAAYDNARPVLSQVTHRDLGVPYRVAGIIEVGDSRPESPEATLTVEAGVTLRFERGGRWTAGARARGAAGRQLGAPGRARGAGHRGRARDVHLGGGRALGR